jgi:hypothetical protein
MTPPMTLWHTLRIYLLPVIFVNRSSLFSEAVPLQRQDDCTTDESVTDGIGSSRIGESCVPKLHWILRGDEGRTFLKPFLENLHEVGSFLFRDSADSEVIDQKDGTRGQLVQVFQVLTTPTAVANFLEESFITDLHAGITELARFQSYGLGHIRLSCSSGAKKQHILMALNPFGRAKRIEIAFPEASFRLVLDVFQAGAFRFEIGSADEPRELSVFPCMVFFLDQKAQKLLAGELLMLPFSDSLLHGFGHMGEAQSAHLRQGLFDMHKAFQSGFDFEIVATANILVLNRWRGKKGDLSGLLGKWFSIETGFQNGEQIPTPAEPEVKGAGGRGLHTLLSKSTGKIEKSQCSPIALFGMPFIEQYRFDKCCHLGSHLGGSLPEFFGAEAMIEPVIFRHMISHGRVAEVCRSQRVTGNPFARSIELNGLPIAVDFDGLANQDIGHAVIVLTELDMIVGMNLNVEFDFLQREVFRRKGLGEGLVKILESLFARYFEKLHGFVIEQDHQSRDGLLHFDEGKEHPIAETSQDKPLEMENVGFHHGFIPRFANASRKDGCVIIQTFMDPASCFLDLAIRLVPAFPESS